MKICEILAAVTCFTAIVSSAYADDEITTTENPTTACYTTGNPTTTTCPTTACPTTAGDNPCVPDTMCNCIMKGGGSCCCPRCPGSCVCPCPAPWEKPNDCVCSSCPEIRC